MNFTVIKSCLAAKETCDIKPALAGVQAELVKWCGMTSLIIKMSVYPTGCSS